MGAAPDHHTLTRHIHLYSFHRLIVLYKVSHHPGDLPHEIVRGIAALLDAQQLLLPLRRHGGGLYLLRHNGGQGAALVRGDQRLGLFITPALHKALLHQLLDDGRAGGGSADPFPLHIFGHLLGPGRLHTLQERVLREPLGRGRFALFQFHFGEGQLCIL